MAHPQALALLFTGAAVLAVDAASHRLLPALLPPALGSIADTLLGHGFLAGLQYCLAAWLAGAPQAQAQALGALCGALSVGMDGDHFLQAGSLSLRAALSLPSRPFAHSLAFLLAAVALAAALAQRSLLPPWAPHLLATALGGHQLRDSLKRGLWVGPFAASPSLPPTPYVLYWCAMALLPLALAPALRALPQQQQQQPPLLPL